ncbi:DsrE/DsrF/DrsH-like family protein [Amycolatopsis alkalitolerans]|uniref:Proton-conducting membrane transporter n=1 Tax=Amycolatopsis alkalitolerans TaxID=2547244 RepID=A0A5C4M0I9_9PSEU|nr:DsrE/DsrF/DrsH-like family protein [Amycolatopsis alkalitolerans]TNC25818.1 proton-conducting membrane transporter [Amycolatopsis alkalitolerans]
MAEDGVEVEERAKRLAMVCWSSDLDRVWPTLILASTAAASGLEVDIFFTFWGLRVLQRNDKRVTGTNLMQKAESLVDRGGTDHLKLGKIHFGGAGTAMIKKLAKQYKVASPTELFEMATAVGVRMHPCQMTMDLYGLKAEDFVDGLQPSLGAASFIDMAAKADITLFI